MAKGCFMLGGGGVGVFKGGLKGGFLLTMLCRK